MALQSEKQLKTMRHSLAHIMAAAVQKLWPEAKFGVGPVIDDGFYYDIDIKDVKITADDFPKIEEEMRKIISKNEPFEMTEESIDKAIDWAKKKKQPYKEELLNDLKRSGTTIAKELDSTELGLPSDKKSKVDTVSFYTNGDFTDLCRGPHVARSGEVGVFRLMSVAGAYWRGKDTNPQMQRLYGAAFETKEELDLHLHFLEQAKERDHRKLGQELDLFTFSDLVGPGLPLFTPRGGVLRDQLGSFSMELQRKHGFENVWTPHIAKDDLYKTSGHYDKFPERLIVTSVESNDNLMMKPMNCPHHTQIYASRPRSYRDLPVRYMENTTNYRDEKSGELHGLSRVRSLSQDDGHVFCTMDQIEAEFTAIMDMIKQMYHTLNMQFKARLSFRDESDNYLGDPKLWEESQKIIESVAKKLELDYVVEEGEAAFYGPKIDIMVTDALGREWQCATEQLDFVQPERFNLEYTDSDGAVKRPVMIHKALLGSIERFMAVYIEHTAGKFPVWLAPEQIRICTINQTKEVVSFAESLAKKAKDLGLRVDIDNSAESVGKKIRSAELLRIPYTVVVGQHEIESGNVTPRIRGDITVHEPRSMQTDEFLQSVENESKLRTLKSSI